MRRKYFVSFVFVLTVVLAVQTTQAGPLSKIGKGVAKWIGKKVGTTIVQNTLRKKAIGSLFLGGSAPKIVGIKMVKEIVKDDVAYYQLKVAYRRASRDIGNSKFPILKAKNYGSAYTHILGLDPSVAKAVNFAFPEALFGGRKFPTLYTKLDYRLFVAPEGGLFSWNYKPQIRKPHPMNKKKLILEQLKNGLKPGKYEIKVMALGSLDTSHPWVQFYTLLDWVQIALNPLMLKGAEKTALSIGKKVAASAQLSTESIYTFEVFGKIPKVRGKNRAVAAREIAARSFRIKYKAIETTNPSKAGKVKKTRPKEGAWKRKGTEVTIIHYMYRPAPVPTPTPSSPKAAYYVFGVQAGNNPLYIIGVEESLKNRAPCSFTGGGSDCSSHVYYTRLAGPFTKIEDAQRALCSNITEHEYWQFTTCRNRYRWQSKGWYWACDGLVKSAISSYCPTKF
jgi:hypothetical protein